MLRCLIAYFAKIKISIYRNYFESPKQFFTTDITIITNKLS